MTAPHSPRPGHPRLDHPRLDHLVVAAATLEEGAAWLEARLGVPLAPGGEHPAFGTHNRLLRLDGADPAYLEVIAVNPAAPPPPRPRWFGLDTAAMQARLAGGPALIHWVLGVPDLDAALTASPEAHGGALALTRGEARWQLSVPEDGSLPLGGALPSLIQWATPAPPARLPASGVRLARLTLRHPEPQRLSAALERLGAAQLLPGVLHTEAGEPGLAAVLDTPGGPVTLS